MALVCQLHRLCQSYFDLSGKWLKQFFSYEESLVYQLYKLHKPYFGWSGDGLNRSLASTMIVGNKIFAAYLVYVCTQTLDALVTLLVQPGLTYALFFPGFGYYIGAACLCTGLNALSNILSSWLKKKLKRSKK